MTESRRDLLMKNLSYPALINDIGACDSYQDGRERAVAKWLVQYPDEYAKNKQNVIGWFQYCPICKCDRQTTCCACGCGNCCYCGHRYSCGFSVTEPLQIRGIEKNAVARPLRPGDSCGLLFFEEGMEEKIREMLETYEYVMVRKKE